MMDTVATSDVQSDPALSALVERAQREEQGMTGEMKQRINQCVRQCQVPSLDHFPSPQRRTQADADSLIHGGSWSYYLTVEQQAAWADWITLAVADDAQLCVAAAANLLEIPPIDFVYAAPLEKLCRVGNLAYLALHAANSSTRAACTDKLRTIQRYHFENGQRTFGQHCILA